MIWLSGEVICRGLDVPDSTWEKKWSVWWGWSRQDGAAMWYDPEDSEHAGERTLSQCFETMYPDPFIGLTVYSFLFKKRKADKHYTGLGGCSSWQRPEQSRWSQQVRRANILHSARVLCITVCCNIFHFPLVLQMFLINVLATKSFYCVSI